MLRTYLSLVAGLALLPGCPLLDVQADVQDVCVTYPGLQIPAQPPATTAIERSFTVDQLDSFKDLADQGFTLAFSHGVARATSGVSDFTFVQHADLAIASGDPSSTLPTLEIFDCDGCASADGTLDVAAAGSADATAYVASGSLVVTIDLAGTAPTVDWTMDVDVCMTGAGSYQVDE